MGFVIILNKLFTKTYMTENNHEYTVELDTKSFVIDEIHLLDVIYSYIDLGKSKSQVECNKLLQQYGINLQKKEFRNLLKLLRINKQSKLILPEQEGIDKEAIHKSNICRLEQFYKDRKENSTKRLTKKLCDFVDPIPYIANRKENNREEGVCLLVVVSDTHFGKLIEYDGINQYNKQIAINRVGQFLEYIERYKEDTSISKVCLCFMGDIVEGLLGNLALGMSRNVELTDYDQLQLAVDLCTTIIAKVKDIFELPIDIYAVPGNHDRITKDKREDFYRITHEVIFSLLQEKFKNYAENNEINFKSIKRRWVAFQATKECRVILNHGDASAKPERLILCDTRHKASHRVYIQGHLHHRLFKRDGTPYTHIITPSMCGPSEYEEYELGLPYSPPGQSVVKIQDKCNYVSVDVDWIDLD